jgi:uncharacterized protein (DUF1778 family)
MSRANWIIDNFNEDVTKAVFRLKIELPSGQSLERDFSIDMGIDYEMLEEELAETPSQHAFLSACLAEQKHAVAKLERLVARRRAVISQEANETAKKEGLKLHKFVLDEIVEADDKILELQGRLMLEQRTLSKLYGFVDSIRIKSDNLRTLAGFKKEELRRS